MSSPRPGAGLDRLSGVIRRTPLVLLAAAVALTGCSTFTDNDVVAEVGDEQLTDADVQSILSARLDDTSEVPYDVANAVVSNWIIDQVLRFDLAAAGTPIDDTTTDGDMTEEGQQASFDAAFAAWTSAEPRPITNDQVGSAYGQGATESGMVCVAHILVDDEETADEVIEQFTDGDSTFTALAAEYSNDPGSAANGGVLPCSSLSAFVNTYVPEFAEAVIDTQPGDVVGPVETQFGYHVIWIRPFADLTENDIATLTSDGLVRFSFAAEEAGVTVDPRFGEFSVASGLIPVG